jgi:hypothetical protein
MFFDKARATISDGGNLGNLGAVMAKECCMCENRSGRLSVLPCAHVFCEEHVQDAKESFLCPFCNEPFEQEELLEVRGGGGKARKKRFRFAFFPLLSLFVLKSASD